MPETRKRPCTICRRWFRPNPRVGERQRACGKTDCQKARRQKTQADWRRRNPDYATACRLQQRAVKTDPAAEPLRMAAPLNQLPWDVAKDQFGAQGADFLGVLGALLLRTTKDQFRTYIADSAGLADTLPASAQKTSREPGDTGPRSDATGISSARSPLGATSGSRTGPPAAADGLAG